MDKIKKAFINYSFGTTQSKLNQLNEIAKRYAKVKDEVFQKYSSIRGLEFVYYPRKLRDEWIKTKYADKFNLPARLWKLAFEEAFTNIKSKWSNTINKVKLSIYKNNNFSNEEKHYAYYLLKSYKLLYMAITFKKFDLPDKFKELNIDTLKIHKYLKNRLRKHYGKKPKQKTTNSFTLDSGTYDIKFDSKNRLWLGITSLTPRKRLHILLSSNIPPNPGKNIRIVLKDNKIEIHYMLEVEPKVPKTNNIIAVSKRFKEVLVSSNNNSYGIGFNDLIKQESNRITDKNSKRNKLNALVRKYESKGEFIKADLIRENNLGKKKYNHQKAISQNKIKTFIGTAINKFFKEEQPAIVIEENLNFSYPTNISKVTRRYFKIWQKGYIKKRLIETAMLNGVKHETVNPAYISQICHLCGRFGVHKNDKFYCEVHGEIYAGYNASRNILARYFDKEITLFTPFKKVKEILQERLRLSNQDSRHLLKASQSESEMAH